MGGAPGALGLVEIPTPGGLMQERIYRLTFFGLTVLTFEVQEPERQDDWSRLEASGGGSFERAFGFDFYTEP